MIYLDHNATTPVHPAVREAMLPWLGAHFGNPSSVHRAGRLARQAIDQAREQVAALVNSSPKEVIFTSGGTEALNFAIRGALRSAEDRLRIGATEHAAVLEPAAALRARGHVVDSLPVDAQGQIDPTALESKPAALTAVMLANNETGVIQDFDHLAEPLRAAGGLWLCDGVQAAGKWPLDFRHAPYDLLSLSGHKINGPKGIGALIKRAKVVLEPLQRGGGHEFGLRAGTENLPGIVGFGQACELARAELDQRQDAWMVLRRRLEQGLSKLPNVHIFARDAQRLPNTCQFAVPGFESEALLMQLDKAGFAVSSGSACHSGSGEPTHVLLAMGVPRETAFGAIRVSLGRGNTEADVDALLAELRRQTQAPAFSADLFG